ncbi:MAG TPA: serine hydrolase [Rhizorhapis sp.]|nr:serine hydrolase [Rhizorhapis sp.]HKR17213.1 serine hydrolase [Rhizorhapis sp.]
MRDVGEGLFEVGERRGWKPVWLWGARGGILLAASAMLASCSSGIIPAAAPSTPVASRPVTPPQRIPQYDPRSQPSPALVRIIHDLGRNFNGDVGIAVQRVDADWVVEYNGRKLYPQQSVSKLWVAMTLFDTVDRGKLRLSDPTVIQRQDLTLFHQPLAAMVDADGYQTTLSDLLNRAMQQSDNTANDKLLRTVGGPDAVRAFFGKNFIGNIRFGPGERLLQSAAAGLDWNQSYSVGRNFYAARANLPRSVREKALDRYLADPPDGAAPVAIVGALAKLKRGDLLSPSSTRLLLAVMHEAKTGPQRIKGGVPPGWTYAHKTGTGQELAPRSTGYNDVGIMTAPDGTSYAVAVMIGSTTQPIPRRWELMQAVSRAVAANHDRR